MNTTIAPRVRLVRRFLASIVAALLLWPPFAGQQVVAAGPIVHVVAYGETLSGIGQQYNVSLSVLMSLNRLDASGLIYPGQRIIVSPGSPVAKRPAATLRLSGVPLYRQHQTLTCEEAAAAMASRGRIGESQLLRVMPRSANPFEGIRGRTNARIWGSLVDYGTYAQGLQIGLSRLGFQSQVLYNQPYDAFRAAIIAQLKAGRPVVWWTTFHEQWQKPVAVKLPDSKIVTLVHFEHTVTIVGMYANGFIYYDPQDATVRYVTNADHQRVSSYFKNMALVILN